MRSRELAVPGAWEFAPDVHRDDRGLFVAPYTEAAFAEVVGHRLPLGQSHHSVSRRGVVRGVHYADVPPGQAKLVCCTRGSVLDVVVDLRVGSATFGRWDSTRLDAESFTTVYLEAGLGHAFVALEDDSVVAYLNSVEYNPAAEHEINPFDPALGLPWPDDIDLVISDRDRKAPDLAAAERAGLLPSYAACQELYGRT